jgi:hypothetical protein
MKTKIIVSIAILGIAAFGGMVYAGKGRMKTGRK